jgi:hypothetical protein
MPTFRTKYHIAKFCIISYTVYNCPNMEKYRVNKIHIGRGEAPRLDMNFIDPIFSVSLLYPLMALYTILL